MATFDYPSISLDKKTNEQNIAATKSYLESMADSLNYYIANLESRIATLESNSKEN